MAFEFNTTKVGEALLVLIFDRSGQIRHGDIIGCGYAHFTGILNGFSSCSNLGLGSTRATS